MGGAWPLPPGSDRSPPTGGMETPERTQEQKILCTKVGLLELAHRLGNASQACKMPGYIRHSTRQTCHSSAGAMR